MFRTRTIARSFSLVELLVAIFISTILMGVIAEVFIGTWRAQLNQEGRTQLQQSSRASLDVLTSTARQAIGVVDSLTVSGQTYTSSATSIVLKLAAIDNSGNPTDLTDNIIFRADPNNSAHLQRIINADPTSARANQTSPVDLTTELGALTLSYYDPSGVLLTPGNGSLAATASLRFTVATSRVINSQTIASQLDDLASLRNR